MAEPTFETALLMQAARSAAVADGLFPEAKKQQNANKEVGGSSMEGDGKVKVPNTLQRIKPPLSTPGPIAYHKAIDNSQSQMLAPQNPNFRPPSVSVSDAASRGVVSGVSALADAAAKSSPVTALPPIQGTSSSAKKKGPPLRRGKWTAEEEAYANRLIQEFKAGLLPLTDGTTLRTFLSKLLNCDPMRISKKFVGSNCIGKQVFRRRTAEINRLTPEQIQQSRGELSELERRFLERVAQTNRVKTSGGTVAPAAAPPRHVKKEEEQHDNGDTGGGYDNPPWLRPPSGYKPGAAAAAIAAAAGALTHSRAASVGAVTNNRAAAAGRALLQGAGALKPVERKNSKQTLASSASHGSAGLLAMAELHRRRSQEQLLHAAANMNATATANHAFNSSGSVSASHAFNSSASGSNAAAGLSNSAMAQIARNASAARIASLAASNSSINNLMLKAGLSRDQLSQLAREQQLASSRSLTNLMDKQSSFDALMSLDFQSLQSIDNLANLIQNGGGIQNNNVPRSGLKNWEPTPTAVGSNGNLAGLASARRLASEGRMESLIRSLSSGNVGGRNGLGGSGGSNANFGNLLQSMQSLNSAASLLGSGNDLSAANAMSLANLLRNDSSTGLTALRMKDGLAERNSSVDDFLSLIASGDIPHQDSHLLNLPLQNMLQQQQAAQQNNSGAHAAVNLLAQQQLLAQAANKGLGNISAASLLNQISAVGSGNSSTAATNAAAASFAQQQQQARAAQMNMSASALAAARAQAHSNQGSSSGLKRKVEGDSSNGFPYKR